MVGVPVWRGLRLMPRGRGHWFDPQVEAFAASGLELRELDLAGHAADVTADYVSRVCRGSGLPVRASREGGRVFLVRDCRDGAGHGAGHAEARRREAKRRESEAYRRRTDFNATGGRHRWTDEETLAVMAHERTDRELARELGTTVKAVQHVREGVRLGTYPEALRRMPPGGDALAALSKHGIGAGRHTEAQK